MRYYILLYCICICNHFSFGQFPGIAGTVGSNAIHADSSIFVAWAKSCNISRGLQDISNSLSGFASVGDSSMAIGKAGVNGVVSLGDGGVAIVTFSAPITNGTGYDFAIFENAFNDSFLELAFVEVSSDGINYVRFPSISNSQDTLQYDNSGMLDATKLNNFAGKYRAMYGTPFDLQELSGNSSIDITNITHIKIIDVVGSLNPIYASYDSNNHIINDPWTTPFPSSGFDLDAVGIINQKAVGITESGNVLNKLHVYPNPASHQLTLSFSHETINYNLSLLNLLGEKVLTDTVTSAKKEIDISQLYPGMYLICIENGEKKLTIKWIKE